MSTGQELGSTGNDAFQLSVRFWTTTTPRDVLGQHLDGDVPPELRVTDALDAYRESELRAEHRESVSGGGEPRVEVYRVIKTLREDLA